MINYIIVISALFIATILSSQISHADAACTYSNFNDSEFYLLTMAWEPTQCAQNLKRSEIPHYQDKYMASPFPDELAEADYDKPKYQCDASKASNSFTTRTFRGLSLDAHAFPKFHRELFFFPYCCPYEPKIKQVREHLSVETKKALDTKYWKDLRNENIHQKQWELFGTCMPKANPEDYFKRAISAVDRLDLEKRFKDWNIHVGLDAKTSIDDIGDKYEEVLDGAKPVFQCLTNEKNQRVLHELWFCLEEDSSSPNGLKFIECPVFMVGDATCVKTIKHVSGKRTYDRTMYIPSKDDQIFAAPKENADL